MHDLIILGRYLLKGHLVFLLPTGTDDYEEVNIHTTLCEGTEVFAYVRVRLLRPHPVQFANIWLEYDLG